MDAEEVRADETGSNEQPKLPNPVYEGEWGFLKNEPCRFCYHTNCVYFLIDDGPEGRQGLQPTRCDCCKRTWNA